MLSAQAAELRELAGDGSMEWVAGPIRAATLRDAADTILSLRDRAQELQAENDKLREDNACLVKAIEELHSVKLEDRLVALENENDRLRELVIAFDWCTENFDTPSKCDQCPLSQSDALNPECEIRMRKLGIEVG